MWLDDCRIPFEEGDKFDNRRYNNYHDNYNFYENNIPTKGDYVVNEPNTKGRFTPNLLVCDDMLNDGVITKSGFNLKAEVKQYRGGNFGGGKTNDNGINYGDKGTNSRYYDLDKWFDKMLYEI